MPNFNISWNQKSGSSSIKDSTHGTTINANTASEARAKFNTTHNNLKDKIYNVSVKNTNK